MNIKLSTLNAKYLHSSLGLRYLYANMGDLQSSTQLIEFTIDNRPIDIAEKLLADSPLIIGLGVYIWNTTQTHELVSLLKSLSPKTFIILGGPEVSYETASQPLIQHADYIICGQGDFAFPELCRQIISRKRPIDKIIKAPAIDIKELAFPYEAYTEDDIKHRMIYVEASRGCPFKCEFCLSSLDKTAYPFDLQRFLNEMEKLFEKGVRNFKFVDRTFNLNIKTTRAILDFFLERLCDELFLHFELIPDHLPEDLKQLILAFPPGTLQFEIGIQTFNPEVQQRISRKQKNEKSKANLAWLSQHSNAHIHADLIFGLPGDTLESFADSFNQLVALKPHEIQVGILKRLKGSPIIRHTEEFEMVYNPNPPFNILKTRDIDFITLQDVNRFARYWDMIANSGRFQATLPLLLGVVAKDSTSQAFQRFMAFSRWLFATTEQTHKISLSRLFDLINEGFQQLQLVDESQLLPALVTDYQYSGLKSLPKSLKASNLSQKAKVPVPVSSHQATVPPRQARHLRN